jgi:5-methylthioadenosine/S-adenosylhomocysteine deaminase
MLSRSQFIAAATRPLRFYREYFRPVEEHEVQKDRQRWHMLYKGVLFYLNIDTMTIPIEGQMFMEIKSQTWSKSDAEYKARLVSEILEILGITPDKRVRSEYLDYAVGEIK